MDNKKALIHWDSSELEENDFWSWDDFLMNLQNILDKKSPEGCWKVQMKNFGWRGIDGMKYISVVNASEFIQQILPNCDCTFYVFNYRNGLMIRNYHHDSPMGNELYYAVPIKATTYERLS